MSTSELKLSPAAKFLGSLVLTMFTAMCTGVIYLVWSNYGQSYEAMQTATEFRGRLKTIEAKVSKIDGLVMDNAAIKREVNRIHPEANL